MSLLSHLASSLHNARCRNKIMVLIVPITAYMDETGHSADPEFRFGGMAGFAAPADWWEKLGKAWQQILDLFSLKEPFHMKDFAHSTGRFQGWEKQEDKRKLLFSTLVGLIKRIDAIPIGAIISIDDFHTLSKRQQSALVDPYYIGFQMCTRGAALVAAAHPPEKAVMVYSYNQEFGASRPQEVYSADQAGRAERLWYFMKRQTDYGKWMGAYSSATPSEVVQLQAADLFAYELAKEFQNLKFRPNDRMRWGLRELLPLVTDPWPMVRLFDRRELLRFLIEGNCPFLEGTEEIEDVEDQLRSHRSRTSEWLRERAGVTLRDLTEDDMK